ncbi:hypothetical protein ACVWWO_003039 [Bradyrhizobium sp. F1.13.1]
MRSRPKGQELPEAFALEEYVSQYLSPGHRDDPAAGCPFAALACEVSRQSGGLRQRFTAGVRGTIALLSSRMASTLKPRQREDKALAAAASMVGALVLARAVDDPKLSDDILRATRNSLGG